MHGEHPEAVNLADVTDAQAQEYIAALQKTGRYDKTVSYSRGAGRKARAAFFVRRPGLTGGADLL